ncbi:hypothetical protein D9M71_607890 [compost metagenome]
MSARHNGQQRQGEYGGDPEQHQAPDRITAGADEHDDHDRGTDPRPARQRGKQAPGEQEGAEPALHFAAHAFLQEQVKADGHGNDIAQRNGLARGDAGAQRAATAQIGGDFPLHAHGVGQRVVKQPAAGKFEQTDQRQHHGGE